jgi:outer membrane cobalamin receptor
MLAAALAAGEEETNGMPKQAKDTFEMNQIVVTGTRVEKELSESPGSIELIGKDKIGQTASGNIADAIKDLPGVDIGKNGSQGQTISAILRGISSEGTLVLLDGVPISNTYTGTVDLSPLLTTNVERVEVLKGPASSIYGANAIGGVINIITKSSVLKPEFTLSGNYGTYNTGVYRFGYSDKSGSFFWNLGGSLESTDGERNNSKNNSRSMDGNITYKMGKNDTLKFSFGGFKSETETPGLFGSGPSSDIQNKERLYGSLSTVIKPDDYTTLNLKVFADKSILNFSESIGETLSEQRNRNIEAQYIYDMGGINILTLGAKYDTVELEQSKIGSKNGNTKSVYLQDIVDLLGSWIISPSIRYDNNSIYGDAFNYQLSVVYNIEDNIQLKSSAGTAFRAPTFSDLYWPYEVTMWGTNEGNPNLKPEKSFSFDAGLSVKIGEAAVVKVTYFNNRIQDMIQWSTPDSIYWSPANVSTAVTYGLENELKIKPSENLSFNINHTWLNAKNADTDSDLMYRPKNRVNAGIEYGILGASIRLSSEYYDNRSTGYSVLESFIVSRLDMDYRINNNVKLTFGIDNLENIPYQLRDNYPMTRRTFNGGAEIKF